MAKQDYSALQELKAAIKAKKPARLYFFYGEEMFLLRYYLGQVKKILIDELTESFNFHRFTNETFAMQDFADAVENLPMMAEFTMVQVDDIDLFKLAEAERNKIIEILSDIPEYCTVVFTYETVNWKADKRQKTLYDVVIANGQIVEFAKQDQRELISWIIRHFAALKKRITPDLCAYLIDITDGTMTSLRSEISKIASYSGADDICKADIDAVTEPVPDAVAFQMASDISSGRYDNAIIKLQQLLKMQEEPLNILGTVGSHFRRIATARTLLDNGKNASELMRLYNMTDYAARKTMESARRFSPAFCKRASELILETDRKIKTSFDAPERLLEILILQLAQEASR
ncbi:MAG: DNA polymerase III subunit delta [Oscillospiraceae bacterium]|nr:DNA polymerase III subunit delta [Oscillospiraceae bacterium]